MYKYLKKYQAEKGFACNLVSMSEKFKGRYTISKPDEYASFLKYYANSKESLCIAEIPNASVYLSLYFDIDFKTEALSLDREYTQQQVLETVMIIQSLLKKCLVETYTEEQIKKYTYAIVLEKSSPRQDGEYVKDGFHIHFPYFVYCQYSKFQYFYSYIFQKIKKDIENVFINIDNITSSILDDIGTKPWLLYGSRKSINLESYKVTYGVFYDKGNPVVDNNVRQTVQRYFENTTFGNEYTRDISSTHFVNLLSIKRYAHEVLTFSKDLIYDLSVIQKTREEQSRNAKARRAERADQGEMTDVQITLLRNLVMALHPQRANEYVEWLRVGFILFYEFRGDAVGCDIWDEFSKQSDKYVKDVCDDCWTDFSDKCLRPATIGTLWYMVKLDNTMKYKELRSTIEKNATFVTFTTLQKYVYTLDQLIKKYHKQRIKLSSAKAIVTRKLSNKILPFAKIIKPSQMNTICIRAPCGFGKTNASIDYINFTNYQRIIIVTNRISCAMDAMKRFSVCLHKRFTLYSEMEGTLNDPFLIIEMESFKRVSLLHHARYNNSLLIVDETDSSFDQVNSPTMKDRLASFENFHYLLKHCSDVLCMSADLDSQTVDFIFNIRNPNNDPNHNFVVHHYLKQLQYDIESEYILYLYESKYHEVLYTHIQNNQKLAIACLSKIEAEKIDRYIRGNFPNKHVCLVTSSTNNNTFLNDIDTHLLGCDIFIYTSTINRGISFTHAHFDAVFCYISPNVLECPQAVHQMMRRCRDVISKRYHVCFTPPYCPYLPIDKVDIKRYLSLPLTGLAESVNLSHHGFEMIRITDVVEGTTVTSYEHQKHLLFNEEDDYYKMTMHNLSRKHYYLTNYTECFIQQLSDMGCKITINDESETNVEQQRDAKRAIAQVKMIDERDDAQSILNAPVISLEEYNRINKIPLNHRTPLEIATQTRYYIFKLFDLQNVNVTLEQMIMYNKSDIQHHFIYYVVYYEHYIHYGKDSTDTIISLSNDHIIRYLNFNKIFFQEFFLLDSIKTLKHSLCHFLVASCGFKNIFDMDTTIANAQTLCDNFNNHIEKFKKLFSSFVGEFKIRNKDIDKVLELMTDPRKMIIWINAKIKMYGLKIGSEDQNHEERTDFKIMYTYPFYETNNKIINLKQRHISRFLEF